MSEPRHVTGFCSFPAHSGALVEVDRDNDDGHYRHDPYRQDEKIIEFLPHVTPPLLGSTS